MADRRPPAVREPGHLMAHVAACRGRVGIARVTGLRLLDLRGAPGDLAEIAAQLLTRRAGTGDCVPMPGGWWQTRRAHRALVLADPAHPEPFGRAVRLALDLWPDVAVDDLSGAHEAVVLAGPGSRQLASSAAARLADPAMVAADGDDYRLLVLPAARADDVRGALLEAGRRLGAVAVDARATDLYRIARRPPRAPSAVLPIHPSPTGALIP